MQKNFKYDVAFSFLAQDEGVATELNDLLQSRLKTFLYSKKQEVLAGTDGELTFNEVFSAQARLVVVLYRNGWGESPWTRIEQTAIRNRAFEHGYDFVKFIPLDESPSVPKWLPRTQIWIGLQRWGAVGAASVIEARVQELGGEPREETVSEKATRVARSLKFSEGRAKFLNSADAVNASNENFEILKKELQREVESLGEVAPTFGLSIKVHQREIAILGRGPALTIFWNYHYSNSLSDAKLEVAAWIGHPPWPGIFHYQKPKRLEEFEFVFDVVPPNEHCWRSLGKNSRHFSSTSLASFLLNYCIELAEKHKSR